MTKSLMFGKLVGEQAVLALSEQPLRVCGLAGPCSHSRWRCAVGPRWRGFIQREFHHSYPACLSRPAGGRTLCACGQQRLVLWEEHLRGTMG